MQKPAVLLNCQTGGVGVLHSLAGTGIDIVTLERSRPALLHLGRYSSVPTWRVAYSGKKGDELVPALLKLAERFEGRAVLFPSTDEDLCELLSAHDELSPRYCVPVGAETGFRIFDKNWQYELADRLGVPLPAYVAFKGGEHPDVSGLEFPLIVKPTSRTGTEGTSVFRLQVLRSASEVERCLDQIAERCPTRDFQMASLIPGEADHLYTVGAYSNRQGEVLSLYSGRKLTQYPYDNGCASLAESVPDAEQPVSDTRKLLVGAGIHGISQVEFKLDRRDGKYKLLEINPRPWSWIELATRSGINLPLIQYYDLTGHPGLAGACAVRQRNDAFFVHPFHIRLNARADERALLGELGRSKRMVSATYHPGDWRLNLASWLNMTIRIWKRRLVGRPLRERQSVTP